MNWRLTLALWVMMLCVKTVLGENVTDAASETTVRRKPNIYEIFIPPMVMLAVCGTGTVMMCFSEWATLLYYIFFGKFLFISFFLVDQHKHLEFYELCRSTSGNFGRYNV